MPAPRDNSVEPWRILILQQAGDEILLKADGAKWTLPEVFIPARQRIAANINCMMQKEFGLSIVSLYEIPSRDQDQPYQTPCHAAIPVQQRPDPPDGMCWTEVRSLGPCSFSSQQDVSAVEEFFSGLKAGRQEQPPQPFLQPNWFRNVSEWVEEALNLHSRSLTGSFHQLNASSTFSLIRFDTDGAPVWFKAVGKPNTREFEVTGALARTCPAYLPTLLGVKAEWNAWLSEHIPGPSLSGAAIPDWENAAASLAGLQILALPAAEEIRKAGARDLRFNFLHSLVAPFFQFISNDSLLSPGLRSESAIAFHTRATSASIHETLAALESLHLPESVGHMDLSPQNIFFAGRNCVFLDWAESFIGCPFFSFEYLLQQFRGNCSSTPDSEARFRDAYFTPWRDFVSLQRAETASTLAPLAALFAYAATLWSSLEAQGTLSDSHRNYLVRLAHRMQRIAANSKGVCSPC